MPLFALLDPDAAAHNGTAGPDRVKRKLGDFPEQIQNRKPGQVTKRNKLQRLSVPIPGLAVQVKDFI